MCREPYDAATSHVSPSTFFRACPDRDGPLREDLEKTVGSLGLGDRVTFLGAVSNPYPLMREADVLVLPSMEEGFGLVAVEAAALGVPFVGSAVGGLREVCEVLGHRTFPVGDQHARRPLSSMPCPIGPRGCMQMRRPSVGSTPHESPTCIGDSDHSCRHARGPWYCSDHRDRLAYHATSARTHWTGGLSSQTVRKGKPTC